MLSRNGSEIRIQKLYELHHIASFIEGDQRLKPDDVVRHINHLYKAGRIDETSCSVKLDNKGIHVKIKDTKETVEFFEWESVKDQAAILNCFDNFKYKYLVLFRCSQYNSEAKKQETELHVFSCETTTIAKSLVDSMSHNKRESMNSERAYSQEFVTIRRGRSEEKLNTDVNAYGKHFYMLNRCIDDIENFEKRLETAITKSSSSSLFNHNETKTDCVILRENKSDLPSSSEAIEILRKVKYALNINEAIKSYTPERTSKQIFMRLFNTVEWLDELSKNEFLNKYQPKMVSSVVEPLLEENTLKSIMDKLPAKKKEFWQSLGPAWNTPVELWPRPIENYSPHFSSSSTNQRKTWHSDYSDNSITVNPVKISHAPSLGNLTQMRQSPVRTVDKSPEPDLDEYGTRKFCENVTQAGGKLCLVTVKHVSAKPQELTAYPGEVLEIIEGNAGDWWTLKNSHGEKGQIPDWKLKHYTYNPHEFSSRKKITKSPSKLNILIEKEDEPEHKNIEPQFIPVFRSKGKDSTKHTESDASSWSERVQSPPIHVTKSDTTITIARPPSVISVKERTNTPISNSGSDNNIVMGSDTYNNNNDNNNNNNDNNNNAENRISIVRSTSNTSINNMNNNNNNNNNKININNNSGDGGGGGVMTNSSDENFIFMTPTQLQNAMKNNSNLSNQGPMILVPVSTFYNYMNQSNPNIIGGSTSDLQSNSHFNGRVSSPLDWSNQMIFMDHNNPNLYNLRSSAGDNLDLPLDSINLQRNSTPLTTGSGWRPAPITTTALGYSPYPFNYPTHMHTMTRELRERLSLMQRGGGSGLRNVPTPTTSVDRTESRLTKYATTKEIEEWLIAHKFSPKCIAALKGFNGMDLYTMNRNQLEQHVGPERCDELFYAFRGF